MQYSFVHHTIIETRLKDGDKYFTINLDLTYDDLCKICSDDNEIILSVPYNLDEVHIKKGMYLDEFYKFSILLYTKKNTIQGFIIKPKEYINLLKSIKDEMEYLKFNN